MLKLGDSGLVAGVNRTEAEGVQALNGKCIQGNELFYALLVSTDSSLNELVFSAVAGNEAEACTVEGVRAAFLILIFIVRCIEVVCTCVAVALVNEGHLVVVKDVVNTLVSIALGNHVNCVTGVVLALYVNVAC